MNLNSDTRIYIDNKQQNRIVKYNFLKDVSGYFVRSTIIIIILGFWLKTESAVCWLKI